VVERVNFFAALFFLVFASLFILPVIMFAGAIAFDWWPLLLFFVWALVALVRGRVF
jgi:hypothetical protein